MEARPSLEGGEPTLGAEVCVGPNKRIKAAKGRKPNSTPKGPAITKTAEQHCSSFSTEPK